MKSINYLGDLIRGAREGKGLSRLELAEAVGYSLNAIADIESGKVTRPSTEKRHALAEALGLAADGLLEASRKATAAKGRVRMPRTEEDVLYRRPGLVPTMVHRVPVLGQAVGGTDGEYHFNGTIIDYVVSPPGMEDVPDAYAVYVDGESMSPRYEPRDTVWVHPGKPARSGDDVIVQIEGADKGNAPRGYIKRFVGWTDKSLRLRQFNPDKEITFPRNKVVSVHPVVFIRPA
ncbi:MULTISPECIES: helix-turn-helix domain-containing protein [unclassified Mesorhizobium]|uniref:helix-turn-helix domain-containing protein n=1 Tax=unclassified Mesorhizobium TaxID=325217 RepID=UPI0015E345B8|nr:MULTISPECIES: helix-turn-helix domain-containing protein [unclassified Mesorhizobium]